MRSDWMPGLPDDERICDVELLPCGQCPEGGTLWNVRVRPASGYRMEGIREIRAPLATDTGTRLITLFVDPETARWRPIPIPTGEAV